MRELNEVLGELISELVGTAAVFIGLSGALVWFRGFADTFISYFI